MATSIIIPQQQQSSTSHGELCQKLIRVSCTKMVTARAERGGARLHKNLLILHLMRRARDSHLESLKQSIIRVSYDDRWRCDNNNNSTCKDKEVDENQPPLELTVRDEDDELDDAKLPLVFAVEARESDEDDDSSDSEPLSSALDDALRRLAGSPPPDGRKRASTPIPGARPTRGAKKTRVPPQLGALRPLACK